MPITDPPNDEQTILGERTALRVGLVGTLILVAIWGAKLQADVSSIKAQIVAMTTVNTQMEAMRSRLDLLEKRGSEPMLGLQKSLDEITRRLDLHMAESRSIKP